MPVIPALERPRQINYEFETSFGCILNSRPVKATKIDPNSKEKI